MNKIKILTIILLVPFGINFVFFSAIPSCLGAMLSVFGLITLVLLNTNALKLGGLIKKLIVWADIILAIAVILFFIPTTIINLVVTNYMILSLLLIFGGLLVAILVKAYNPETR